MSKNAELRNWRSEMNRRWEEGIPHDQRSEEIAKVLKAADKDFSFDWKSGGDGDNLETLMYQLDVYFAELDEED